METVVQNLITAIGWSIIHSLWQGAVIYGLLLLILNTTKLDAKTRYATAYSASVLMLAGFVVTFFFRFQSTTAQPATQLTNYLQLTEIATTPLTLSNYVETLFPYLVSLYAIGIFIQSLTVYSGYKKVAALKKALHLPIPADWQKTFNALIQKMSLRRPVTFWLSSHVSVPLVIGYLKPVILFPVAMSAQMDLKQVEAILIHELSHIRRNDYLFNLIRTVMETVLFFNPFIWLTGKFIDIEREHACDDLVLELTHTPMTYAHALLQLELLTDTPAPHFALAATGKKQYLYQRIKRITDMKTTYMNSKQKIAAITLTIATVISLAWINPVKNETTLKNILKKNTNFESKTLNEKKEEKVPELLNKEALQDTTRKKLKRKVIIKGMTDSCVVFPNGNHHIDSTIQANISKELSTLKKIRINMDSVTSFTFKDAAGGLRFDGAGTQRMAILSREDQENLKKLQEEMKVINKKMMIEFNPEFQAKLVASAKKIQLMVASPEFKSQIADQLSGKMSNMKITIDGATGDLEKMIELNKNPDYKALKKKFDDDVKALLDKKQQKGKDNW